MENKFNGNTTEWVKDDYHVKWNCNDQCYYVYYKGNLFATKYKFSEVVNYLN